MVQTRYLKKYFEFKGSYTKVELLHNEKLGLNVEFWNWSGRLKGTTKAFIQESCYPDHDSKETFPKCSNFTVSTKILGGQDVYSTHLSVLIIFIGEVTLYMLPVCD